MISRRNFLKVLGVCAAYFSTGFSVAHAVYKKSTIFLTDFGGLIYKPVKEIITDNKKAQEILKNNGLLHPRGTGHSVMGKSIEHHASIFTPEDIDITFKDEIVYASAGTTLLDIDNYLEQHGYMLPTTPDHRAVSLGGVLSVGGYGIECCLYGALVDHVEEMDLMDNEGKIWKSLKMSDARVQKALCGLGKHGYILSAGIRCVPKPVASFMKYDEIPDVDYYVQAVKDFMNDPDRHKKTDIWHASWFKSGAKIGRGKMTYEEGEAFGSEYKKIDDHRADRKKLSDGWVFRQRYQYYIWTDIFFTIDNFKPAFERAMEIRQQGQDDGASAIIYSSIGMGRNDVPKTFPHYDADNNYLVSIGIFANYLPQHDREARKMARAQMLYSKEAQEKWDGRQYRYGWEWQEDFKGLDF